MSFDKFTNNLPFGKIEVTDVKLISARDVDYFVGFLADLHRLGREVYLYGTFGANHTKSPRNITDWYRLEDVDVLTNKITLGRTVFTVIPMTTVNFQYVAS